MSELQASSLAPLVRKLQNWSHLDDAEQRAVLDLPHKQSSVERGSYLLREGDQPRTSCVILSGFSYRQKCVPDGGMQILSVHMKGDLIDLETCLLGTADHSVQALTQMTVAQISSEAMMRLIADYPKVGMALWLDTLVDSSIFREWIVNVGRRSARERIAHLLCEFAVRLEQADLGDKCDYELPMTQDQLADCTGLTSVHVNRTLQGLDADNLIVRNKRSVKVPDWHMLADVGGFQSQYLNPFQKGIFERTSSSPAS